MQQSGPVLRNDLEQGTVGRALVVVAQLGFYLELGRLGVGAEPRLQQAIKRRVAIEYVQDRFLEALSFGRVELQRAEAILEIETVHDYFSVIGKSAGLGDVHAPSVEDSG